jgi:predicted nucleic acid-binding protein
VRLLLDTNVLGQICHPRKHGDVRSWLRVAVRAHVLLVSELADYELRRELLRIGATRSLSRLDTGGRA